MDPHDVASIDTHGITLTVVDRQADHFVVAFNRPGRIEISLLPPEMYGDRSVVLAHVYEGAENDPDQEPLFAYDGGSRDEMVDVCA